MSMAFNAHDELNDHADIVVRKHDLNELVKAWKMNKFKQ
jgi:hypothetical protein